VFSGAPWEDRFFLDFLMLFWWNQSKKCAHDCILWSQCRKSKIFLKFRTPRASREQASTIFSVRELATHFSEFLEHWTRWSLWENSMTKSSSVISLCSILALIGAGWGSIVLLGISFSSQHTKYSSPSRSLEIDLLKARNNSGYLSCISCGWGRSNPGAWSPATGKTITSTKWESSGI